MSDGSTADGDSNAPIDRSVLVRILDRVRTKIHYHETWPDGAWDCRWDRHPNSHNTDEHFHPPPDAPANGEDESFPGNLHDVMRVVENEVNTRIRSLWEDVP